jgi:endonuclease YncB( thermonuclease family)
MFRILSLFLLSFSVYADSITLRVVSVYDGDTIKCSTALLPYPLSNISVRLKNIDTPELRGKCEKEKQLAKQAKARLKELTQNSHYIKIDNVEWDKYGGRILGNVIVNGKDVSAILISEGLGRKYNGEAKKSWCN